MGRIPDGRKFTTPGLGKPFRPRDDFLADEGRRVDGSYYVWEGKRRGNPRRTSTLVGIGLAVVVMAVVFYALFGRQILGI